MPSYIETVKIPFGGLELINIPVEEIHVRYKAGPDPEVLVVKELWVKPRQWVKGNHFPGLSSLGRPSGNSSLSNSGTWSPSPVGLPTGLLICWCWWTAQQPLFVLTSSYKEEVFFTKLNFFSPLPQHPPFLFCLLLWLLLPPILSSTSTFG